MFRRPLANSFQLSNTTIAAILGFGSAIIGYATTAFAARQLGPTATGEFFVALNLAAFLTLFAGPGTSVIAQREISRNPRLSTGISTLVLFMQGVAVVVLYAISIIFFMLFSNVVDLHVWGIIGLTALFTSFNVSWLLQARQVIGPQFLSFIAVDALLAAIVYLTVRDPDDLLWYSALYTIAFAMKAAAAAVISVRLGLVDLNRVRLRIRGYRPFMAASLPMAISLAAVLVYYNSDTLILNYFHGNLPTGQYAAAYSLMLILCAPCFSMLRVHFGLLSAVRHGTELEKAESSEKFIRALCWVGAPLAAAAWSVAPILFPLLYGQEYEAAVAWFRILCLNVVFIYLSVGIANPLITWGYQGLHMKITVASAVLNLALNVALIPAWGGKGAAIATLIAEAIVCCTAIVMRRKLSLGRYSLARAIQGPVTVSVTVALIGWLIVPVRMMQ